MSGIPGAGEPLSGQVAISVMLIVPDAQRAAAWYEEALGAGRLWDLGSVVGLEVAGAPFFLHEVDTGNPAEASPEQAGATSTRIELFVDDPAPVVARAVSAGATLGSSVEAHERPWGAHRQGGFVDPFGHHWSVGDPSPIRSHPTRTGGGRR
jgi:PhnB protein